MVDVGRWPDASMTMLATIAGTRRLHDWLDVVLGEAELPEKVAFAARLCLEEAVMNVVLHGYGATGAGEIKLTLAAAPPGLLARVVDRAPPFDPSQAIVPPAATALASGPLGGRGLLLIRRFAHLLHYERVAGQNRLTMGFVV